MTFETGSAASSVTHQLPFLASFSSQIQLYTVGTQHMYWHEISSLNVDAECLPALTHYFSCPVFGLTEFSAFRPWLGNTIWAIFALWPAIAIFPTVRAQNARDLGASVVLILGPWLLSTLAISVLVVLGLKLPFTPC
jgi:hypothetical protein